MLTGFQTAFAEISSEPKTISPVIRKKTHTSTTDSFRFGGHVSLTKSIMLEHMKAHLLWKHKPLALLRKLGESTLFSITPSMPHKQYSFRFPSPLVSVCCRKCDITFDPLVCFPRPKKPPYTVSCLRTCSFYFLSGTSSALREVKMVPANTGILRFIRIKCLLAVGRQSVRIPAEPCQSYSLSYFFLTSREFRHK